jgi:hypothetical protein
MEEMLVTHTQIGDLILFSNDAPSFIWYKKYKCEGRGLP